MSIRVITLVGLILAMTTGLLSAAVVAIASMIIAGNGPELATIERLAGAFEKSHLGSVVEIHFLRTKRHL